MSKSINKLLNAGLNINHKTWVPVIEYLVRELSSVTKSKVDLGPYWVNDGGFCSRVRPQVGLPDTNSDYWEASVCFSFIERNYWATAKVFLFRKNKILSQNGVIEGESEKICKVSRCYDSKIGGFPSWLNYGVNLNCTCGGKLSFICQLSDRHSLFYYGEKPAEYYHLLNDNYIFLLGCENQCTPYAVIPVCDN